MMTTAYTMINTVNAHFCGFLAVLETIESNWAKTYLYQFCNVGMHAPMAHVNVEDDAL